MWRGPCGYRKEGDPEDIAAEAARLAWLTEHGFPCPRVVDHQPGVLVMTAVPGRSAAEDWPDDLRPRVVDAFADALRALHDMPTAACPFDRSLAVAVPAAERAVDFGRVNLDALDPERRRWTAPRLLEELHRTRPTAEDLVVCHGDPCLANLLFDDDGRLTGVIDVGRLGVADRYHDLAIATRSLANNWGPSYADRLLKRYGLPAGRVDAEKIRFYQLLDEFF